MTPAAFLAEADKMPPFLLCALARDLRGNPISTRQLERMTGWAHATTIKAMRGTSWARWSLGDMIHLHRSLRMITRRLDLMRAAVARGEIKLDHIPQEHWREQIKRRLVELARVMVKERKK